ncbi:MAG: DMT family transporter [Pseudomonadota bacterium]
MKLSENARGALLMVGSMTAFTLNDACMKGLAGDIPLAQAIVLRGIGTTILLYGLARAMGQLSFRLGRRDAALLALRTATEIGAAFFFLSAVFNMPLANATAILQVLPLAVTLTGALVFREPLGWRRLTAIAIGFVGVMLIVRPGADGFTIYSVYALAAVGLVTVRDLAARRMSAALPSLTVAFVNAAGVTLAFSIGAAFEPWAPVSGRSAVLLVGAMVWVLAAYVLSVTAMRVGELSVVAPFRYTSLVVALLVGLVAFQEWPDAVTLAGASLVVATGIFTLWREGRLRGA